MKIVDISYAISDSMPVYPGDMGVSLKHNKMINRDHCNSFYLQTALHAGTHVDIPMHLLNEDLTVDLMPLDNFMGNGVLLDVRGVQTITYKDEYDKLVSEGDIVLLFTDFCNLLDSPERYYSDFPVIDMELVDFFISKKIKMLGLDTPSPDKIPFVIHKKLLANSINILENITGLEPLLNVTKFEVFAVPLKIQAEASLVRAFCKIPND